jgi:two-component system copper resistance phosphate regulon response regulator CusR
VRLLALGGQAGISGLVNALDRGADDFLYKPFSLLELMARVRALRRRSAAQERSPRRRSNGLVLFADQCRVERDGRSIDLTPREFALLEVLVENAGKTLSRAMLTQRVWNMSAETNTNIVDVYIKYLRDKIDGDHDEKLIRTIRGLGYVLQA